MVCEPTVTDDPRQWLTERGFPLGPVGADLELFARWRGRRLHVNTACEEYRKMASWRTPVTVLVQAADVLPEHLCHLCGRNFTLLLRTGKSPGATERTEYLREAAAIARLREELDTLEAKVRKPVRNAPLPTTVTVAQVMNAHKRATELHAKRRFAHTLGPAAEAELRRAEVALAAVRAAWSTPAGRNASAAIAARDVMLDLGRRQRSNTTQPVVWPADVGPEHKDLSPHYVRDAAKLAYEQWRSAIGRGESRQAREAAAMAQVKIPSMQYGDAGFKDAPAAATVQPGETVGQFVRRSLTEHCTATLATLVAAWETELEHLVGTDTHLKPYLHLGPMSRLPEAMHLAQVLASTREGAWLAVPANVLRLCKRTATPVPGALTAPQDVLAATITLVAAGVEAPQEAFDAVRVGMTPASTA